MNANKLIYRNHAIKRMFERGISETDVRAVIDFGEVIQEYPDDMPYPKPLDTRLVQRAADSCGYRLRQPGKNGRRDHRL